MSSETLPSTQPYLLRALHEWCTDNNLTPLLLVKVDGSVQVPPEFVRDGQIVLNISYDATAKLQMGNDYIEFQARFGGVPRQIVVPVTRVMAIYARENNQGMGFAVPDSVLGEQPGVAAEVPVAPAATATEAEPQPETKPSPQPNTGPGPDEPPATPDGNGPGTGNTPGKRPALRRVK